MKNIFFAIAICCFISCSTGTAYDEKNLYQEWAATEILTEGQPDPRDATGMRFAFDEDHQFAYKAFDSAQQNGSYELKGDKLRIKPETGKPFFILVKTLNADTLRLEMNDGKNRLITLSPMAFESLPARDSIAVDSLQTDTLPSH